MKFWAVVFLDNLYSSCFHVDKNYASKLSDSSLSGINCRVFLENCLFFYFQLIAEVQTPAFGVCMIVRIGTYILYCGANFEGLESQMRMLFPLFCLISPHLAGSKIPARNRGLICPNGFQTTACTTGACGTDGFCAVNHVQKIIRSERKPLKTTENR